MNSAYEDSIYNGRHFSRNDHRLSDLFNHLSGKILMEFGLFLVCLLVLSPLLGRYIAWIFEGESKSEMHWIDYGKAVLYFNLIGLFFLILLQRLQGFLPINPQGFGAVPWALAVNTAVSFVTNTNWQAYSGESTMSYFTQMLGLTVQNFASAGTGVAVFFALLRGITRKNRTTIGNFWTDLWRSIMYLLLPLSIVLAVWLMWEGVIQTLSPYVVVETLEKGAQTIALGPVASQEAIKMLGTNGGGFFGANSAHPFENPSVMSNFLEAFAIVLIPGALVHTYGRLIGSKKHGWILFFVMLGFWLLGIVLGGLVEETKFWGPVPNMEGKEARLGVLRSVVFAISTTSASNGAVNAMMSSLTPLTGGLALFNIKLGEIIFGGVGVGMCSMIMFVLLTVFLAGLMVGRTPEYLGKKIGRREMRWVVFAILLPGGMILVGSGLSSVLVAENGLGPHGLTAILYAFSSAAGNNGSAFGSLDANTDFYNMSLSIVMLMGRIAIVLSSLAIAGLFVQKNITPASVGTFSTNTILFSILLSTVILVIGGLTFFPAFALGPIVEHLLLLNGRFF